jgi:hypothetical protein
VLVATSEELRQLVAQFKTGSNGQGKGEPAGIRPS